MLWTKLFHNEIEISFTPLTDELAFIGWFLSTTRHGIILKIRIKELGYENYFKSKHYHNICLSRVNFIKKGYKK